MLEKDSRLLIDIGLVVCVEGGREGDLVGDLVAENSRFIERRLSENEVRLSPKSLMKSLITVIEDLRSLALFFGALAEDSLDKRLSWMVSFGGSTPAL